MKTVAKAGGLRLMVFVWQPGASEDWSWAVRLWDTNHDVTTHIKLGSRLTEKAARRAAMRAAVDFAGPLYRSALHALRKEKP